MLPAIWLTGTSFSVALALTGVLLAAEGDILNLRTDDEVRGAWIVDMIIEEWCLASGSTDLVNGRAEREGSYYTVQTRLLFCGLRGKGAISGTDAKH